MVPTVEGLVLRRAAAGNLLPRPGAGHSPQRLLSTLLGEYWSDTDDALPLGALVDLLQEFGISETSARATVTRLAKRGMLEMERVGRLTRYRMTADGRQDVGEQGGAIRDFAAVPRDWDGRWTVAAFSVPEDQRQLRHHLRSYLRWLGFASLFDGLWVAPRGSTATLEQVFRTVGVDQFAVFRTSDDPCGREPLTAWDLTGVETAYRTFVTEHRPLLHGVADSTPASALVTRTRVFEAWRTFPALDPDLPQAWLPEGWPRAEAREVFVGLYNGLATPATARFRQLVAAHDPVAAGRASERRLPA
ncbi:transcriptional regulator, PaaX family [Klenkia soli]|uniref:Transcriptional regulator, PaaX family n=1 Tax=Klenkia soli TaxID=1052260 RepID=A0A1H0JD80_9ACTN|nr:PaaX family transcriptional regulator C-terminal domain-containing protein [Klenkia soli]SDO41510.1 transcriptional regulator, PaaX family [Klenkia soli]